MEASSRTTSPSRAADRDLLREGLDQIAGLTGGDVFRVVTNADFAFQRLATELSGYYLLSFEPEPGDRDGRAHKIKIDVRRRVCSCVRGASSASAGRPARASTTSCSRSCVRRCSRPTFR